LGAPDLKSVPLKEADTALKDDAAKLGALDVAKKQELLTLGQLKQNAAWPWLTAAAGWFAPAPAPGVARGPASVANAVQQQVAFHVSF
jgi:hypothetical protein